MQNSDTKIINYLLVIFFSAVLYGGNALHSGLRLDSIMYADIAKNILLYKSYFILHLNDSIYLNKPPLLFWIVAFFIKIFGSSPYAIQISAMFNAILMNIAAYHLFKIIFKESNLSFLALFCMNSTFVIYKHTHSLKMESLTSFFILISLIGFIHYLNKNKIVYLFLFSLGVGGGILAKGFLGLVPIPITALFFIFSKEKYKLKTFYYYTLAILAGILISGWWYVYISLHSDFFHVFFVSQSIDRLAGNASDTVGTHYDAMPIYQYIKLMLRDYFYYLPFFIYGCYKFYKNRTKFDPISLKLIVISTIFNFMIIHFITTRDERYMFEFYLTANMFTAYGLHHIIKKMGFNYKNLIKSISIIFLCVIAWSPSPLSRHTYNHLSLLPRISKQSHLPILVDFNLLTGDYNRSAINYFLSGKYSRITKIQPGNYITIYDVNKNLDIPHKVLFKDATVKIAIIDSK